MLGKCHLLNLGGKSFVNKALIVLSKYEGKEGENPNKNEREVKEIEGGRILSILFRLNTKGKEREILKM